MKQANILFECKKYLKGGLYIFDKLSNIAYKPSSFFRYLFIKKKVFSNFSIKKDNFFIRLLKTIRFSNLCFVSNKNKKNSFQGSLVIVGTTLNGCKIFNFKSKEVLSFSNKDKKNLWINRKKLEKCGFNLPKEKQENKDFSVEKFIEQKNYNHFTGFVSLCVFYTNKYNPTSSTVLSNDSQMFSKQKKVLSNLKYNTMESELSSFVSSKFYIRTLCHGDLHYLNYLFDGREYFFIDFELVDNHIFFYDLLFYIYFDYLRYNTNILKDYFSGRLDNYLIPYFNRFNVTFDKNNRRLYFFIMLFEYYNGELPIEAITALNICND